MRSAAIRVIFAAALASSCSKRAVETEDCHWIGSVNPLTGGLGPVGLPLENAAKLAVQDINRAGGVAGKRLCIATGDDRTNPERAERVVNALIDTHDIRALNGAAASSATLMAARAAEQANMAIVSCCSTSPELSLNPLIYRTVPSDALQGVALADLAKSEGAKEVAIIHIEGSYGSLLKDEFERAFVGDDRRLTRVVAYQERQSSYTAVVADALNTPTQPDHVVLIAYPVEGVQIIRDWKTSGAGRTVKWLATDGLRDDNFGLSVAEDVPGLLGTAPIPNGRQELYDQFVQRYQDAYGGELPGIFTSNQYDAVILIALGIARAGPRAERDAIRNAIPEISRGGAGEDEINANDLRAAIDAVENNREVNYSGVSGEVDLDDNGDVLSGYRVWSVDTAGRGIAETDVCFRCDKSPVDMRVECTRDTCR